MAERAEEEAVRNARLIEATAPHGWPEPSERYELLLKRRCYGDAHFKACRAEARKAATALRMALPKPLPPPPPPIMAPQVRRLPNVVADFSLYGHIRCHYADNPEATSFTDLKRVPEVIRDDTLTFEQAKLQWELLQLNKYIYVSLELGPLYMQTAYGWVRTYYEHHVTLGYLALKHQRLGPEGIVRKLQRVLTEWIRQRDRPRDRPHDSTMMHKRLLRLDVRDCMGITELGMVCDAGEVPPCLLRRFSTAKHEGDPRPLDFLECDPDREEVTDEEHYEALLAAHNRVNDKWSKMHELEHNVRQPHVDWATSNFIDCSFALDSNKVHPHAELRSLLSYLCHCLKSLGCQGPRDPLSPYPGVIPSHRWHITLVKDDTDPVPVTPIRDYNLLSRLQPAVDDLQWRRERWSDPMPARVPPRFIPGDLRFGKTRYHPCMEHTCCKCGVCNCCAR